MNRAVFAGSFDPPTFGHLNIIERSRGIFEELLVVVAVNRSKQHLFTEYERCALLSQLVKQWDNVSVHLWEGLIVDFAREHKANVLIRGIRNMSDFSYEFDLSLMNKGLDPQIETLFMPTEPRFFVLRSSSIKELAALGGDVSTMVPPVVVKALKERFGYDSFLTK